MQHFGSKCLSSLSTCIEYRRHQDPRPPSVLCLSPLTPLTSTPPLSISSALYRTTVYITVKVRPHFTVMPLVTTSVLAFSGHFIQYFKKILKSTTVKFEGKSQINPIAHLSTFKIRNNYKNQCRIRNDR